MPNIQEEKENLLYCCKKIELLKKDLKPHTLDLVNVNLAESRREQRIILCMKTLVWYSYQMLLSLQRHKEIKHFDLET